MTHHKHHHRSQKNLGASIALNILITLAQIIGGVISGSLALLSDALHNFTDVVSLVISYIASVFAKKKASVHKTFGYKRAEIIAAFINASSLIVIAIILIVEAVERFITPQQINSSLVIWLSALAIVFNGLSVLLLMKDRKQNMNLASAYLHLLTDMLASVAVLIGGVLMKFYNIYWVDSLLTAAIAIYLIIVGIKLLRNSFRVLMLFTPESIEISDIVNEITQLPLIKNMHHVHIWQLNEQELHLEAEIDFTEDIKLTQFEAVLEQIEDVLLQKYGINHVTIQPEFNKSDDKHLIVQD